MAFEYPVALEVRGRPAVVIGTDAVVHGKADALLEAGAFVTVVAGEPASALDRLEERSGTTVRRRPYRPGDLAGAFVCVASSKDAGERAAIHREAEARGVLVNVMDDPEHCHFAAPAVVRRGDLVIAVSTGGRAPALARWLRVHLAATFGPEWEEVAALIGAARAETLPALPELADRARRWRRALDPHELLGLLRSGRGAEARSRLLDRLLREGPAAPGEEAG